MGAVQIVLDLVTCYSAMWHHTAGQIPLLNPLLSDINKCHPVKLLAVFVSKDIYFYDPVITFHWYTATEPHKAKSPFHVKTNVFQWETLCIPVAKVKVIVTYGALIFKKTLIHK